MSFDNTGQLYGTTIYGGPTFGSIYTLDPATGALRTEVQFKYTDGGNPIGGLLLGAKDVLYGTASAGGPKGGGVMFSFEPHHRVFKVLHGFSGPDGATPVAGLVADGAGVLYGTTALGGLGAGGSGTVFKYDPTAAKFTTLYAFKGAGHTDGGEPQAPVAFGPGGLLYGTTSALGGKAEGSVFSLDPATQAFKTLHAFTNGADGANPTAGDGVLITPSGILYGVTYGQYEELPYTYGTIYSINLATNVFTTLYTFSGGADGAYPAGGLIMDAAGMLYGVTSGGGIVACGQNGDEGCGTVFQIAP